jgi:hypothetical protein
MLVTYGGTQLGDIGATRFTWQRALLRNNAGIGYGFQYVANFSEIFFRCASQDECRARMGAIGLATSQENQDLIVWNFDGTPSDNAVLTNSTLSGVRCTSLVWLDKPGAQFLTHRVYAATFEWETRFPTTANLLMDFKETITTSGGTPLIVILEPINALPVAQITVPQQGVRLVQEGMAVGYQRRPNPLAIAPPIWPAYLTGKTISKMSGERVGFYRKNFGIQWRYEYASPVELAGEPTEWIG